MTSRRPSLCRTASSSLSERPGAVLEEIAVDLPHRAHPLKRRTMPEVGEYAGQIFRHLKLEEKPSDDSHPTGGNDMKRLFLTTVAAAALAVAATSADAAEEVTYLFRLPTSPGLRAVPARQGQGLLRGGRARRDLPRRQGRRRRRDQLAAGNADLGGGIGDTPIIVRANGLDVRGVALLGGHGLTQLAWRKDSGITGPKDFEGKNIGVLSFQDTTHPTTCSACPPWSGSTR